jgi:hypothetical protein
MVSFNALFFMVFLDKKTLLKPLYFVRLNLGLGILGRQTFLGESEGVCFHWHGTYAHCEHSEAIQKCRKRKNWITTPPTEARNCA